MRAKLRFLFKFKKGKSHYKILFSPEESANSVEGNKDEALEQISVQSKNQDNDFAIQPEVWDTSKLCNY